MKRVLILLHHYHDPTMGGIRARRVVRGLPAAGYEPTVLTLSPGKDYRDDRLPGGGRLIAVPAVNLAQVYARMTGRPAAATAAAGPGAPTPHRKPVEQRSHRLTSFINRWLMIPDKEVTWVRPVARAARSLTQANRFDAVFASMYPRSNLVAAARIARQARLPLITEYRDLWTGTMYHNFAQPTPLHRALHRRIERSLLARAQRVSCLCQGIGDYLGAAYPEETRDKIRLNYNFFDPAEYPAVPDAAARTQPPFIVTYAGAIYFQRSPFCFLDGMRQFIDQRRLQPSDFVFRWLGPVVGVPGVQEHVARCGLEPYLDFTGLVPHATALQHLLRGHVSLLIQAPEDTIHVPGKLFEALGARRPLLAVANPCEVTQLIDRTGGGVHCPYEAGAVADALGRCYDHWRGGQPWPFRETELRRYQCDDAIARLAATFDEVAAKPPGAA